MSNTQDIRRVTWSQAGANGRDVFVVCVIVNGQEVHRATRFVRSEAEQAADRWCELNGYTITRVQAGGGFAIMSNAPKITIIYRRPEHGGTKPVIRAGSPMLTVDTRRLANAGAVSSMPVSRRPLSKAAVILSLLLLVLLVLMAALVIGTSERKAHAQEIDQPWCEINSAPMPQSIPQSSVCIMPRVYLPEVRK